MLVLNGANQVPARDDATTCSGALKNINQPVPPAMASEVDEGADSADDASKIDKSDGQVFHLRLSAR